VKKKYQGKERKSNHKLEVVRGQELLGKRSGLGWTRPSRRQMGPIKQRGVSVRQRPPRHSKG
jgi:hypothetical protein